METYPMHLLKLYNVQCRSSNSRQVAPDSTWLYANLHFRCRFMSKYGPRYELKVTYHDAQRQDINLMMIENFVVRPTRPKVVLSAPTFSFIFEIKTIKYKGSAQIQSILCNCQKILQKQAESGGLPLDVQAKESVLITDLLASPTFKPNGVFSRFDRPVVGGGQYKATQLPQAFRDGPKISLAAQRTGYKPSQSSQLPEMFWKTGGTSLVTPRKADEKLSGLIQSMEENMAMENVSEDIEIPETDTQRKNVDDRSILVVVNMDIPPAPAIDTSPILQSSEKRKIKSPLPSEVHQDSLETTQTNSEPRRAPRKPTSAESSSTASEKSRTSRKTSVQERPRTARKTSVQERPRTARKTSVQEHQNKTRKLSGLFQSMKESTDMKTISEDIEIIETGMTRKNVEDYGVSESISPPPIKLARYSLGEEVEESSLPKERRMLQHPLPKESRILRHPQIFSAGFENLGNTCYMNAVLQALFGLPNFKQELIALSSSKGDLFPSDSIYRALIQLIDGRFCLPLIKKGFLQDLKASVTAKAAQFDGFRQHDAHEFIRIFLSMLNGEIEDVGGHRMMTRINSFNDSPVTRNFCFKVWEYFTCTRCDTVVQKEEDWYDLPIAFESGVSASTEGIQKLVDKSFKREEIEFTCRSCSCKKSYKKAIVSKLPRVLTIYIKRYVFDKSETVKKIHQKIAIDKTISLAEHSLASILVDGPTSATYQLVGIVSHIGDNPTSGHYIADVCTDGTWNLFNDNIVTENSETETLEQRQLDAYILFYANL